MAPRVYSAPIRDESSSPAGLSLETLLQHASRGEDFAFTELVRRFLRPGYLIALAILRRPADAEDVAQEAMLAALQHLDSCRQPERFAAWFAMIARNHARNWLKQRKLRDVAPTAELPEVAVQDASGSSPLSREQLLVALSVLGEQEREVILLHELQGCTHAEIASMLGMSEVMSRQHLFNCRRKLRQHWGLAPEEGS